MFRPKCSFEDGQGTLIVGAGGVNVALSFAYIYRDLVGIVHGGVSPWDGGSRHGQSSGERGVCQSDYEQNTRA